MSLGCPVQGTLVASAVVLQLLNKQKRLAGWLAELGNTRCSLTVHDEKLRVCGETVHSVNLPSLSSPTDFEAQQLADGNVTLVSC